MKKTLTLILALYMMLMLMTPAIAVEKQTFTDVPTTHWAYANIEKAVEMGLLYGMGDNKYAPEATLSAAQFITIIGRVFYNDDVVAATTSEDNWYSAYVRVAQQKGVLNGVSAVNDLEGAISRYDMAQLMYNASNAYGLTGSIADSTKIADYTSIPPMYNAAVVWNYGTGFLVGFDSVGNFVGTSPMTRAQAATVLVRITDQIAKEGNGKTTGAGEARTVQPGKGAVQPIPEVLPTDEEIAELVTNKTQIAYDVSDEGLPAPGEDNDYLPTALMRSSAEVEFARYVDIGNGVTAIAISEAIAVPDFEYDGTIYDTQKVYTILPVEDSTAKNGDIFTIALPQWTLKCIDGEIKLGEDMRLNSDGTITFQVNFDDDPVFADGFYYSYIDSENHVMGEVSFDVYLYEAK